MENESVESSIIQEAVMDVLWSIIDEQAQPSTDSPEHGKEGMHIAKQQKIKWWAIVLPKDIEGVVEPAFYYNFNENIWTPELDEVNGTFTTREKAMEKLVELKVDATFIEGKTTLSCKVLKQRTIE